jgi:hypothetical protein
MTLVPAASTMGYYSLYRVHGRIAYAAFEPACSSAFDFTGDAEFGGTHASCGWIIVKTVIFSPIHLLLMVLGLNMPGETLDRAVLSVAKFAHVVPGFRIHFHETLIRKVIGHRFICEPVELRWVNTLCFSRLDVVRQNVLHAKQATTRVDRRCEKKFKASTRMYGNFFNS